MPPQQNHELPAVAMPEQVPPNQGEDAFVVPTSEKRGAIAAERTQMSPPPFAPYTGAPPLTARQTAAPATSDLSTGQPATLSTNPTMADDVDLIEKEWISKAKAIVERTRDDPREQNKEMNRVKADYIKKRYDKDIKLDES